IDHGYMSIFSGIAITATVSGILLLLCAGKLVSWMHGVETSTMLEADQAKVTSVA
ncbi:dipeptide/tripeptide permease, partial [Vibrio artabrorum]